MKENRKAYASLCSAMLIFGTIAIFRRNIPFSSGLLAFSRGLLGGVFLLIFVAVKRHRMEKVEKKQLALLIPYLLLTEDFSAVVLDARTVVLVLIVGIVHSGLAYALYFGNVNKLPAQSVAVLSYIDPVSSLFFSALLLHERLTAFGLLGAVLIFGSALVSELGGKKRRQNTAA